MRGLILFLCGVLGTVSAAYSSEWSRPKIKLVEVEKKTKPLPELIAEIPPKYNINPLVIAAIVRQESGGKVDAIRFEPGQVQRARKVVGNKSEDQIHQYASSHGVTQIMGWWAPEFNLSWKDLYDPETNIEVASAILRKCLDKSTAKTNYARHRDALKCWNGSEKYADTVLASMGRLLLEDAL